MAYPNTLDNLPVNNANDTASLDKHPALHNDANGAVNRMQAELGTNPAGGFGTVAARLTARPTNIAQNGGALDGSDVAEAINQTIADSQAAGGGVVELGAGEGILEAPVELVSGVYLLGEGEQATVLKGKPGTGHDLIRTVEFDALDGNNVNAGPANFGLEKLTLDGNADNRSGGRGIALYGKAYRLMHFMIRETDGVGLYSNWYSGGDEMEAQVAHFKTWRTRGHGIHYRGPHDSCFMDGQVIAAGYGGASNVHGAFVDSGSAAGTQFVCVHTWGIEHARAWYVTTNGTQLLACQGEGAQEAQLFLDAQDVVVMGGHYFGVGGEDASRALVVGDLDTGGYPARCQVQTKLSGSGTLVDFRRLGGRNVWRLLCHPLEGGVLAEGIAHESDVLELTVDADTFAEDNLHSRTGRTLQRLPVLDGAVEIRRSGDDAALFEFDTSGEPTARFSRSWVEAYDDADEPAWEISPTGAAIFTKSRAVVIREGGLSFKEGPNLPTDEQDVILFARDNGSGKTQLMAQFATGAPVQVAIEP